jgi:hypothetical protein
MARIYLGATGPSSIPSVGRRRQAGLNVLVFVQLSRRTAILIALESGLSSQLLAANFESEDGPPSDSGFSLAPMTRQTAKHR